MGPASQASGLVESAAKEERNHGGLNFDVDVALAKREHLFTPGVVPQDVVLDGTGEGAVLARPAQRTPVEEVALTLNNVVETIKATSDVLSFEEGSPILVRLNENEHIIDDNGVVDVNGDALVKALRRTHCSKA